MPGKKLRIILTCLILNVRSRTSAGLLAALTGTPCFIHHFTIANDTSCPLTFPQIQHTSPILHLDDNPTIYLTKQTGGPGRKISLFSL